MATTIIDFWRNNRSFWITPPSKQKEVDDYIIQKFWYYNWTYENLIGKIIYLDQFSRHFARGGVLSEENVAAHRKLAQTLVMENISQLDEMDEVEIIFALMPFKHAKEYDFIFEYLHMFWLDGRPLTEFPDLQRFYMDTYKKAFTLETIRANIITEHNSGFYDPSVICDYYPDKYREADWYVNATGDTLLRYLNIDRRAIVSLSGGVDSMVMLYLLKHYGVDVSAIHIVYGNRAESEDEYRFLAEYCHKLGIPFFVYRIKWLRRGEVDRTFYEEMTRDIRFMVYQACTADTETCVLLGHIKNDVIENIWTNIAHCHHLGNLKKMEREEVQLGVRLLRPFLEVDKADIYRASEKYAIPYLKNTTPSWSNRGKFREQFYQATLEQFGPGIDSKIIEFAEAIQAQNTLLNKLLYEPIYSSFKNNKINITTAVKAKLDATCWLNIFEHICHKYLAVSRPSIKSVREFHKRLLGNWTELNVELSKYIKIRLVATMDGQYIMEFICK